MKGITEFRGYVSQLSFDVLEGKFEYQTLQPYFTAQSEMSTDLDNAEVMQLDQGARAKVSDEVE